MKKLVLFLILIVLSFNIWSCSDWFEDDAVDEQSQFKNTLGSELSGKEGSVSDYFYNFGDSPDINASFFRYNPSLIRNYDGYASYYGFTGDDPPLLNYKTFPDHLVAMTPGDESEFIERFRIDSLTVLDSIISDSVLINSTKFKNLEKLEWNLEAEPDLQRYKLVNSDWISSDTTIYYSDTFDVSAYWAVVDTPFINDGLLFVDSSEWNDTNYVFNADEQIGYTGTFSFVKRQMSADSLVFRVNTDCNDNGQWDNEPELTIEDYNGDNLYEVLFEYSDNNNNGFFDAGDDTIADYNNDGIYSIAYEFVDIGNGLWDPAEPFYDIDGDGEYDSNEPYQDRNCNDTWDPAEQYVDLDSNLVFSEGDSLVDVGNRIFDGVEAYTEIDIDGVPTKFLYQIGEKPDNLLVDWTDGDNPQVLLEVLPFTDLSDRWGNSYTDIIEEIDFYDVKTKFENDRDSLVTLFTREKVGHILGANLSPDDYHITKSEWLQKDEQGRDERVYNYQIFHQPNHLNQVVFPSYFLPVGFYVGEDDIADGFWHKKQLESEVLYYASNGLLREGEAVDTAYYDTTEIAVYFIEKSYRVESASVTVPAGHRQDDNSQAVDTTFNDCFKITKTETMTMLGSGVDFGQRTETWLAKNIGLVKSEIYVRWTEHPYDSDETAVGVPDENNEAWVGFNRLELQSIDIVQNNGLLRILDGPIKSIKFKDIGDDPDFNYEPLRISTQTGIQTLDLRELNE